MVFRNEIHSSGNEKNDEIQFTRQQQMEETLNLELFEEK
jgi:hypothetical protein